MNKKSLLGLLLFACVVITGLFAGATLLTKAGNQSDIRAGADTEDEAAASDQDGNTADRNSDSSSSENNSKDIITDTAQAGANSAITSMSALPEDNNEPVADETFDLASTEAQITDTPSDMASGLNSIDPAATEAPQEASDEDVAVTKQDAVTTSLHTVEAPQLIINCNEIDYRAYIPEMVLDSGLEAALDISNPGIDLDAEAAILLDATTKKVLYYKNAVQAMFPASTAKLLSSLVILKYCKDTEEVTIGDEITMIASDSTRAYLEQGQILTIRNLLTGMLLPSGNDAAYAAAAYVGRKSLDQPKASKEEAVAEFVRLMNEEASNLGVKNSCFKTPDGYDAVGQYTTAYDMGLIGIAASNNSLITDIAQESTSRNTFISGEDVTWNNTNKLITRYSGQYYSKAIGLKTGTSSMAGRCIVAAAENEGKKVVCVILDSTSVGRWEDAIELLKYGLR